MGIDTTTFLTITVIVLARRWSEGKWYFYSWTDYAGFGAFVIVMLWLCGAFGSHDNGPGHESSGERILFALGKALNRVRRWCNRAFRPT